MFPYYTFNLLAGFDKDGNGITYGYDAVGSYDTK
jgi:20S proteasome subunit beta 6